MMKSNDVIHIALPSDQNYFQGLIVTTYSIAKTARKDAQIVFHIIDGGIPDDGFIKMGKIVTQAHPASKFIRHKMAEQDFSAFPPFHGNRMTYARFILPTMLSDQDFVIFADSDCLWLADVADLWVLRDDKVVLKATYDEGGDVLERPWFTAHGLPLEAGTYFCNGLLLMNLRLFRERNIAEKAAQFVVNHQDLLFADQTAFNAVIGPDAKIIPAKWNVFTRSIRNSGINQSSVLHYANQLPWRDKLWTDLLPPFKNLWHETYCKALGIPLSSNYKIAKFVKSLGLHSLLLLVLRYRIFRWPLFGVLRVLKKQKYASSLSFFRMNHGAVKIDAL